MRILQVSPKFHESVASGSTKVAYDISQELVRRGHSVTVYTSDMKDKYSRVRTGFEKVDGLSIYRFQSIGTLASREMKVFATPSIISKLKSDIQSFEVVHLQGYHSFQNIILCYYAEKYGIPYMVQAHGSLPRVDKRFRKWLYDVAFGFRILRSASKVVALSDNEAKDYERMGVPRRKITIIPNGIHLSEYVDLPPKGSFREKFKLPENKKIILYLGRIHRTKGIDLLIKAYSYLIKNMKCDNSVLVIAGPDDGYLADAKASLFSSGVSHSVFFTGFVSNKDKLAALAEADLFVTPSFYGFPMTFLEACAVGTPIVTTTYGDSLEWIDNHVGFVTQPTCQDVARAMRKITLDIELRKKFSRNCKKIVRADFSLDKVVDRLEDLYKEVAFGMMHQELQL